MTQRTLLPVALSLLAMFLLVRGITPAWTRIDTDFPNYYTSGKILLEGGDVTRLYDDAWFQRQITAAGFSGEGKFSPFPPATALISAPLALLPPQSALRALTILNLIALLLCIGLLARIATTGWSTAAVLVLLGGQGLANAFRFGQLYILMTAAIITGWTLARGGRHLAGGMLLGLFLPIKYYPVAFLPYYVMKRQWRTVGGMFIGAGAVATAGWAIMGTDVHMIFFRSVLGEHLHGALTLQDPFSSTFQTFPPLFRRLFVFDDRWNPSPLFEAPFLAHVLMVAAIAAVLAFLLHALRRTGVRSAGSGDDAVFALWGIGALLAAPATATYHMVLLWLPVLLLAIRARHAGGGRSVIPLLVGAYGCIGFLPMAWFRSLDGGWTTPFAYPRLALIALIFGTGTWLVSSHAMPGTPQPGHKQR